MITLDGISQFVYSNMIGKNLLKVNFKNLKKKIIFHLLKFRLV